MDPLLASVAGKTRAAYNLAARRYDELFRNELAEKPDDRRLLDVFAAGLRHGARICDAGCGSCGHVARHLAAAGLKVVGVDIAEECLAIAAASDAALHLAQGDVAALPFRDGSFDGIIAYYSVINTPKRLVGSLFGEFHRALAPGGRLLVTVKEGEEEGYERDLLGIAAEVWMTRFTEAEITDAFRSSGFVVELLEKRRPYPFEIAIPRITAIGRRS